MADIAVLGIGLDTRQAERNAKNLTQSLNGISTSTGGMTKAFFASQIAFSAVSKAANFLKGELSAIVTTGMQFQASMSQVKAVSGATQARFEQLTAAAKNLGETTKFSASEAANGLVLLSQAGLKAEQSIAALPDVLNLAAAGGLDMGTAADIATNAMSGMRLGVEDLARITDVFAKTATSSNTNVAAMGESFKYVASIGASAGVSVERLSAMIGILGNAGIQGSMAGTQLAFGISKMASEGKDFFTVLKELEATGADTTEVMDMFGERAGRAVLAILGQGVGTLEQFEAQLMNSAGAAKEMARIMSDDLTGDVKNLESAIEAVRINFFDVFNDDLRSAVQTVTGAIRENKDTVIELVRDGWDYLQAVGGSLSIVLGGVFDGISSLNIKFSEGATQSDKLRNSGLNIVDAFSAINHTVLDVTTAFQKLFTVFSGPGEVILNNISALLSGDFGQIQFKNPLVLLDEIANKFSQIDREAAKTRRETNSLFDEMRDKTIATTDAITAKNFERQKSEQALSASAKNVAEITAAKAAKTAEAAEKTGELKEEALDLDAAFNALTRATQELNVTTDDQKIKADFAAEALYRQKSAADSVAGSFQVATAEVKKYADQTSRAFATGSILGDMGGLVGSTFSVESPRAATASPASQMSAFSASPVSSGATSNISSLMSSYDRLANQITDYLQKDVSLDIKLKDAEQELRTLAGELANVGQNELEKQLELSEQYFATVRKIDDLQSQISKEQERTLRSQQSTAQGLGSILDSVLSDYDSLVSGDFAQLLPVERVQLLSEKFNATAEAINKIDWTEITSADTQLIAQFQNVSKSFLDESQKVFKSSANYDAIKESVKGEFDSLASSLATAMEEADPTTFNENLDKLKTSFAGLSENSVSAKTNVSVLSRSLYLPGSSSGLKYAAELSKTKIGTLADTILSSLGTNAEGTNTKTATFAETLKTLGEKTETSGTEAKSAAGKTTDLSNTLSQTAAPLASTSGNLEKVANNTAAVFAKIVADSAAMKTAIDQQKATLDTRQAQIDAIGVFSHYQISGNTLQGLNQLGEVVQAIGSASSSDFKVSTDQKQAYRRKVAGETTVYIGQFGERLGETTRLNDGTVLPGAFSGQSWSQTKKPYYTYEHFSGGNVLQTDAVAQPFARGAWSINKQVQPAMLHQGEMVIRSDDAPAVRSFMASTGRASTYGTQNSDNGGAMGYDSKRMIELLAEIADLLSRGINPQVFLNAKKVSEELDRFRSLSA